ncbi:MAG: MSEP-CTERM sorting domain-containing protein [Flavobacteriales bacterium]|nr:MSEP-CTERM sorting domain-containing protein [Flavobacteriales bacterium]
MRTALHPIGILIGHTLPVLILAMLYASMLSVVHPLLSAESINAWIILGSVVLITASGSTAYALIAWRQGRMIHPLYAAVTFLVYVPVFWGIAENMSTLFPWDIPRWMIPEDAELYAFRLLCIPLAHALLVLVISSLRKEERGSPLRDLLIAAGIPIGVFLFVQVIEPFRRSSDFEQHAWVVVMVTLVIGFLFFLMRGVVSLVQRAGKGSAVVGIVLRTLIALVFPLLGLAFNNGLLTGSFREVNGIFGDLSHPAFYIIAILNAAVVIWPSSSNMRIRMVQFILRAIGYAYVLYFFVLFLPLLPVSIVAIIAIGIGFLLLAPILLFAVQSVLLYRDLRFLAARHSRINLLGLFAGCLLLIPAAIVIRYLHHRTVLHSALHHVYESDPSDPVKPLDEAALASVFDQVDANRSRGRGPNTHNTPFLTPLYNRIVLDNLTISEEKLATLRAVFLNEPTPVLTSARRSPNSSSTSVDTVLVRSTYDAEQQVWRSQVDLRVINSGRGQEEFVTDIALPEGAWITDHYLVIEGDTVPGILAEKKAAMWVYNNIVNYRRDPSIMRYTAPGHVQLRVFPVEAHDMRASGFELIHKEGLQLVLGADTVQLADHAHDAVAVIAAEGGGAAYVPSAVKATLPRVRRQPHFHFVVDGSEAQRGMRSRVIDRIATYIAKEQLDPARITMHIADAYGESLAYGPDALAAFEHHVGQGGFFSDRVIRKVINNACSHPTAEAPVIVIVPSLPANDDANIGVLLDDLSDIAKCLPEGDSFFVLDENPSPTQRWFSNPSRGSNGGSIPSALPEVLVLSFPDGPCQYLRNTPTAEIIVDPIHMDNLPPRLSGTWQDALALEARWRAFQLRGPSGEAGWSTLVRGAFQAQVLTPLTAWMCVENDAQRNVLLKKQEEILNGDPSLDANDQDLTNMSEPGILWMLVPVLLWIILGRRTRA